MKITIHLLIAAFILIGASSCEKKSSKPSASAPVMFNHATEYKVDGQYVFMDSINISHFQEEHIIDGLGNSKSHLITFRIKDTIVAGNYAMTDDPYNSQVFFYYSDDPENTGYLPQSGAQMKIIEHNKETRELKAIFSGTFKDHLGQTRIISNGSLKVNY